MDNNDKLKDISILLKKLDIDYNDINHYITAFTHSSFVHENIKEKKEIESYERLEFLGDSILGQIVAEYIFKKFEKLEPGTMTLLRSNVVSKNFLSKVSKELNFKDFIITGIGESKTEFSDSIYEDVFESLVSAIYLDVGYNETKKFVHKNICQKINEINVEDLKDYKTKLQELFQADNGKSVTYDVSRINKKQIFSAKAIFEKKTLGTGEGKSKKEAEQMAARDAYKKMVK